MLILGRTSVNDECPADPEEVELSDVLIDFSGVTAEDMAALRDRPIVVRLMRAAHGKGRIGFEAPSSVTIVRRDVLARSATNSTDHLNQTGGTR